MRVEPRAEQRGPRHARDAGRPAEHLERAEGGVHHLREREHGQAEVDAAQLQGHGAERPREDAGDDAAGEEADPRRDGQLCR